MEIITLEEFTAKIETTFSIYAETNDIDRQTIKTLVIECLRQFGKNICDKRDAIVEVKNSRVVLNENFKSLILALKIRDTDPIENGKIEKRLIVEKQKIENPVAWDAIQRDYVANYCESKILTEKTYVYNQKNDLYYNYEWLSLKQGIKSTSLDVKCLNMHPSIRGAYPNYISITNRTINANFKEGKIYLQYNALPSDEDGEIGIPTFSNGAIEKYVENHVRIHLSQHLIINGKAGTNLNQILGVWMQQERQLLIEAKSEASWNGIDLDRWSRKIYKQNRFNQQLYNLPK
jgi:hypothetical protein